MKISHFKISIPAFLLISFFISFHIGAAQEIYEKTPADYEGPFYPVTKQQDIDNNLTQIKGQSGVAQGQILNLSGKIVNIKGQPLENLIIEIWQTDPQGQIQTSRRLFTGRARPQFPILGCSNYRC